MTITTGASSAQNSAAIGAGFLRFTPPKRFSLAA